MIDARKKKVIVVGGGHAEAIRKVVEASMLTGSGGSITVKPNGPIDINQIHTMSLHEIADALSDGRLKQGDGRTLPKGLVWSGHDIPGRGKAAARRLKQLAKKEKP